MTNFVELRSDRKFNRMMDSVPKLETIRGLLENSGNQCAFPGCNHPVLNHRNQFIAKLAYIDSSNQLGNDKFQSENLMFLCYRHYVETLDSITYPVEILKSIKENHETSEFVGKTSRFQINTITSIQESAKEQELEDKQWEQLQTALVNSNEVDQVSPSITENKEEVEDSPSPEDETEHDAIIVESIKALSEELEQSFESEAVEEQTKDPDIIKINAPEPDLTEVDQSPRKLGRIRFKNSDSKRLQLQLTVLKTQMNELFGMMETLRQSDKTLNKELKGMVSQLDILGIFHHRFSKLPFRNNPFINRNHNSIHAKVPKLRSTIDSLIHTLENIIGGKQDPAVQNIKEDELPHVDRPTTRILIKSIRYADQIAN